MNTKGLLLHCGSRSATLEEIEAVPTPEPDRSHYPIPHAMLIRHVREQLEAGGVRVTEEAYGLSEDGMRLFGTLALRAGHLPAARGSDLVLGLRNSHDKTFCAGLALGNRVLVCDNLSFVGTRTLARKHTRFVARDLPGLVARILGQLADWASRQAEMIGAYEAATLSDAEAHDFMIRSIRSRVIAPSRIGQVVEAWHAKDERPDSCTGTLWGLFNAYTEALKGTIELSELARRTEKLHGLANLEVVRIRERMERLGGNGSGHGGTPAGVAAIPADIEMEPIPHDEMDEEESQPELEAEEDEGENGSLQFIRPRGDYDSCFPAPAA